MITLLMTVDNRHMLCSVHISFAVSALFLCYRFKMYLCKLDFRLDYSLGLSAAIVD